MIKIFIDKSLRINHKIKILLDHIFSVLGCAYDITEDPNLADVIYSGNRSYNTTGAVFLYLDDSQWASSGVVKNNLEFENYDCIYNCFYLMFRLWEDAARKDNYGVVSLRGGDGPQIISTSYVGEFIHKLRGIIRRKYDIDLEPLWPRNAKYCVVFSHDVDQPFEYLTPRYYRDEYLWKRRNGFASLSKLKSIVNFGGSLMNSVRTNRNYGFRFWNDLERSLGGKSAFYVSVKTPFDKNGHQCDVPYHNDDTKMVTTMNEMINEGWEIGLHASMNSYQSSEKVQEEKYALERVLGGYKLKGIRHHYWRLGDDIDATHQRHYESGFQYDSSLGLNDFLGFRAGTVWPYKLVLDRRDESKGLYEIPPTIMDGNIFYDKDSKENYINSINSHFSYVKSLNGCVVLDWHLEQSNFSRLNGAGRILEEVLDSLNFSDCFVTSPEGLLEWWVEREKRIFCK